MTRDFRILVVDSPNCIKLLKYIDANIESIVKSTKYFIDVVKLDPAALDDETNALLKRKGITGLPVMIAPNKKVIPGAARIIQIFDAQTSRQAAGSDTRAPTADMGTNPDLASFYAREMFDIQNGVLEKRTDSDDSDNKNADADIDQKMRNYRAPTHRGNKTADGNGQGGRSALDTMMSEALGGDYHDEEAETDDNVGAPQPRLAERYGSGGKGSKESDMDAQILNAFLENVDG